MKSWRKERPSSVTVWSKTRGVLYFRVGTSSSTVRQADLVDGVVALAQFDGAFEGSRLLGLGARTGARGDEEDGSALPTEVVAHHLKGARGVAKGVGHLGRRSTFNEVGAEGFVLALLGRDGVGEEALTGS
jgi:hypothetical protein